jgi:hypothetical protein
VAAFNADASTFLLAGLAANSIGSLANGFMPAAPQQAITDGGSNLKDILTSVLPSFSRHRRRRVRRHPAGEPSILIRFSAGQLL